MVDATSISQEAKLPIRAGYGKADNSEFIEVDETGRYGRTEEVLGRGAYKTVYRGFDKVHGMEVAWNQIKVEEALQNPLDMKRLYSEIELLKTVKHQNIIKCYSSWIDEENATVNIITEIFNSGTLRQYRKKHKELNMNAVKNWARQILRGLFYLHGHNPPIIHRDLKCDNLFINGNNGKVKIGDFGLATIMRQAHAHSVIGTPEFMAPEIYEADYDELVDIYAFGMCLLEMVTCEYPYSECKNPAQIYKRVTSGIKPAALHKVNDPQVRAVIDKCLATATQRPPATELLMDPFLRSDDTVSKPTDPKLSSPLQMPTNCSRHNMDEFCTRSEVEDDTGHTAKLSNVTSQQCLQILEDNFIIADGERSGHVQSSSKNNPYKVKGNRKDDNTVSFRLHISEKDGPGMLLDFPFDIHNDTTLAVAKEMILQLDFPDKDAALIADALHAELVKLVPDWKFGVSINMSADRVAEGFQEHKTDSVMDKVESVHNAEAGCEELQAELKLLELKFHQESKELYRKYQLAVAETKKKFLQNRINGDYRQYT